MGNDLANEADSIKRPIATALCCICASRASKAQTILMTWGLPAALPHGRRLGLSVHAERCKLKPSTHLEHVPLRCSQCVSPERHVAGSASCSPTEMRRKHSRLDRSTMPLFWEHRFANPRNLIAPTSTLRSTTIYSRSRHHKGGGVRSERHRCDRSVRESRIALLPILLSRQECQVRY